MYANQRKPPPGFFDETGLEQMRRSLSCEALHVAVEDGRAVGFATVTGGEESEKAEVTWLAVGPRYDKEMELVAAFWRKSKSISAEKV